MADPKNDQKKKSTAQKVVEGVKSAAKAMADVVSHPKDSVKHAADRVAHAVTPGAHAGPGGKSPTPRAEAKRGARRALLGIVKSDKMDKTVVVEVVSLKRDPVYGKYLKSRVRYKAHDEKNQYHTGDRVEIKEHRPLSRDKRFIVSKLIDRAKVE
ncbi:MAG: hypothetical protein NVS3B20_15540 [Polyangiales bacterium]